MAPESSAASISGAPPVWIICIVSSGFHAAPFERLDSEVMGGRADARDADLLAAQIFQPFDFRLGENALGQMILMPAINTRSLLPLTAVRTRPTPPSISNCASPPSIAAVANGEVPI